MNIENEHCAKHDSHICGCAGGQINAKHASFASVESAIVKLHNDYQKVRAALVGLVGMDTKEELDAMEMIISGACAPEVDKAASINAIAALRDTLPEGE